MLRKTAAADRAWRPVGSRPSDPVSEAGIDEALRKRVGTIHLKQRLGIESEHEADIFGQGLRFFHLENWYSIHSVIRTCLRVAGLRGRGRRNALAINIRHNEIRATRLPRSFEGYRVLQVSDPHVDMSKEAAHVLAERVREADYDLCVLTGDYRAKTFGPFDEALAGMARVRLHLDGPLFGVLGNHDTIRLVPGFEKMGIRMLLNESVAIERGGDRIYLAGIDDAHYYRVDNVERAAGQVPHDAFSILLSHTPERYRHAAHAGFNIMLCGHTHGGQICLPGGVPIIWDARCPRRLAAGPWRHRDMIGYTSVGAGTAIVEARLNCPPEITVHQLCRA